MVTKCLPKTKEYAHKNDLKLREMLHQHQKNPAQASKF